MDLYVVLGDRDGFIDVLTQVGFTDYYAEKPYDRKWIYRALRDGVIIDVIWQMANYRAQVDEAWLTRGPTTEIRGWPVQLLAPEELIWSKLYALQRDRCDWPDLLNILYAVGPRLDWEHLVRRVGEDLPVLAGLLSLFSWLCPMRAHELPEWVWSQLGLSAVGTNHRSDADLRRAALLDSRDWFGPTSGEMHACSSGP
jgi:hypothetical protein